MRHLWVLPFALLAGPACSGQAVDASAGVVRVYTPHSQALVTPVVEAFGAAAKVRTEIVTMESALVLEKLRGEQRAAGASGLTRTESVVWWGADEIALEQAAAEGLLTPVQPSWARGLAAPHHNAKDLWSAQFLAPFAVVHRRGVGALPARFEDLASPAFRGRLLLRLPTDSWQMRLLLGAVLEPRMREAGGSSERAFDWFAMLDNNRVDEFFLKSDAMLERLASAGYSQGPGDLTIWTASEAARLRDREGYAIGFTVPVGSPAYLEGVAIVAGSLDLRPAEQFVDFIGRDEFLAGYVQQGKIPLPITRVELDALPGWMGEAYRNSRLPDRAVVASHISEWMALFEQRLRSGATPASSAEDGATFWLTLFDIVGTLLIVAVLFYILRKGRWRTGGDTESGARA